MKESDPRLRTALKAIIALATTTIALGITTVWSWKNNRNALQPSGAALQLSVGENPIQKKFPNVDFSTIYPDLSPTDIDELQRECLGLRYVYSPFVEFEPRSVRGRFVNILPGGFRKGETDQPWPARKEDFVVFVFGGSTTFGFGVPDNQTVVAALQADLAAQLPGRDVKCYNFGRGYYFSTQERELFASLLARGHIPNLALFIDGLNDFAYFDGVPELTPALFAFTAPDLKASERVYPANDTDRATAVGQMLNRYQQNVRMTEALAAAYAVSPIFIGQPVPFLDFPVKPSTYPFTSTYLEHQLCGWGYQWFKRVAGEGYFGPHFIWCGDAFENAESPMYVDSIHYSRAGAATLAQTITTRLVQNRLLPLTAAAPKRAGGITPAFVRLR
jgi:hypothetical protein